MQLSGACSTTQEQVVGTVLQLVVEHADVSLKKVACWLLLSKSIKTALQQASGDVSLSIFSASIETLTAVAHWLPRHAGLVSTLVLWRGHETPIQRRDTPEWAAVEQMISQALQLSSRRPAPSSSTTTPQAPALPVLHLKAFHTMFVFQPAALEALACSNSLTRLSLVGVPPTRLTPQLCTALGSLRGLRTLFCSLDRHTSAGEHQSFPPEFPAAVAELTQLDTLRANALMPATSLAFLPASLTHLETYVHNPQGADAAADADAAAADYADLDLGHLTKLQSLDLSCPSGISARSQLPACLSQLTVSGPAEAVSGLQQLQKLQLEQARAAIPLLQHAAQQPQLQHLGLALYDSNQQQLRQIADALSRCKQLTELCLTRHSDSLKRDGPVSQIGPEGRIDLVGVRLQLANLRQLQRLQLEHIKWDILGVSQLVVLTSITKLCLDNCNIADAGLALLFQRLTGLRQLTVSHLPDNECLLVALAGLTNLEGLTLREGKHVFTDSTLPLLSPLTKLTLLCLDQFLFQLARLGEAEGGQSAGVSAEVEEEFLAGMPSLNQIAWR